MSRQTSRSRSRSRLPQDLHLTVPRSWITPDGRRMRRPFRDTEVIAIQELRKSPGIFSVRLFCKTPQVAIGLLDRFSHRKFSEKRIFCEPFVPRAARNKRHNIPLKHSRSRKDPRRQPRRVRSAQVLEHPEEPRVVDFESDLIAFKSMDSPTRRPRGKYVIFGSFDEEDDEEDANETLCAEATVGRLRAFSFSEPIDLNERACYDSDSEMGYLG